MDYKMDVEKDAVSFIENNFDEFKEGVVSETDFSLDDLGVDDNFHEEIVDRAYTLVDAAYIVENCDDLESDSGYWNGQEPADAIKTQAAFSFGNDVRNEVGKIYKAMQERMTEIKDDLESRADELRAKDASSLTADERAELEALDNDLNEVAGNSLEAWFNRSYREPEPSVDLGSDQERYMVNRWLDLNSRAGMWGGFSLGDSYIDARCGVGYSMPDIKDYVDFDRRADQALPHLQGKGRNEIREYLDVISKEHPAAEVGKGYDGTIVGYSAPDKAIQNLGRGNYVTHDVAALGSKIEIGASASIKYDELGKAAVRVQEKGVEKGVER